MQYQSCKLLECISDLVVWEIPAKIQSSNEIKFQQSPVCGCWETDSTQRQCARKFRGNLLISKIHYHFCSESGAFRQNNLSALGAQMSQVSMVIRFLSEPHDIVVSHRGYCSRSGRVLMNHSSIEFTPPRPNHTVHYITWPNTCYPMG